MKKNIIKSIVIAVVAIFAGYNVYQSNVNAQSLGEITLTEVEAIAACEVSHNPSNNKGICLGDISNGREYCVNGSTWSSGPECSATI